jgi:hypothetical protein
MLWGLKEKDRLYRVETISKVNFHSSEGIRFSSSVASTEINCLNLTLTQRTYNNSPPTSEQKAAEEALVLQAKEGQEEEAKEKEEQDRLGFEGDGDGDGDGNSDRLDSKIDTHKEMDDINFSALELREKNARKIINRFVNRHWQSSTFFAEARISSFKQYGTPYYFVKQDKIYANKLATLGSERSNQMVFVEVGGITKRVKYL